MIKQQNYNECNQELMRSKKLLLSQSYGLRSLVIVTKEKVKKLHNVEHKGKMILFTYNMVLPTGQGVDKDKKKSD